MNLDLLLVPLGVFVFVFYYSWLIYTMVRHPHHTVIGLNALARKRWVALIMSDPIRNGVLAVQTLRNNIMASTVLATTAVTLSSLIGVFVSATVTGKTPTSGSGGSGTAGSAPTSPTSLIIYGSKSGVATLAKFFSITLCLIFAFLCNVQSIRYYTHVSFLIALPMPSNHGDDEDEGGVSLSADYVAKSLNRGSYFWSIGLRAFYLSFILFLWIFGPIPMIVSSILMCCLLYFFDTTNTYTRNFHLYVNDSKNKQLVQHV